MTISFSIGLRHVLEDCLKALRGRALDPDRRAFALDRGTDLVAKARRGQAATAAASGFLIEAPATDLDAFRFILDHGGARRDDLAGDLRAAETALTGLARGRTAVAARDIAATDDLLSTILSVGMLTDALRAMETV